MKKIIVVGCVAVLSLLGVQKVWADAPQSIAIIDTGVNTSLFPKIVAEYCVLEYTKCPNGKQTMEGTGAANIPVSTISAVNHGNELTSIISTINPNANLIPIKIVGTNPNGNLSIYSNNAVKLALDWVVANRTKYNITVVNIAAGKIFAGCVVPPGTAEDIAILKANNVAVIGATGNDSNRTAMHSVACLPDVVSIGATDNPWPGVQPITYDPKAAPYIARYSNGNSATSFYLNARWKVMQTSGIWKFMVGTSNSAAAMSGWWSLNRKSTWQETYDFMVANAKVASNAWLTGRYVYVKQGWES